MGASGGDGVSPLLVLAVAGAGGIGAALRYLVDNALPQRVRERFPAGTALVNLTGSFALGVVAGLGSGVLPDPWAVILGTGLLGGYTTFSTASLETVRLLLEQRRPTVAVLNGIGMLVACVALAAAGYAATLALTG